MIRSFLLRELFCSRGCGTYLHANDPEGKTVSHSEPDSLLAVLGICQLDPRAVITNRRADLMSSLVFVTAVPSC